MRRAAALFAGIASFGTPTVFAASPSAVALRVAAHPGYVRLALDYGHRVGVAARRTGNSMVLSFTDPATIAPPPGLVAAAAPDLRAATFEPGTLRLTLAPGVTVRTLSVGTGRVIDLIDAPVAAAQAKPPPPRLAPIRSIAAATLAPTSSAPPLVAIEIAPTRFQAAGPIARALDGSPERQARPPLLSDPGATLALPFGPGTGAAAFRRGGMAVIVFDEPRSIDVGSLRAHPGAESATVQQLPEAVVLRLHLPPDQAIALRHDGATWSITLNAAPPPPEAAIAVRPDAGLVDLALAPGHVVAIPDPVTGDDLLVGTTIGGGYVAIKRQFAEFALLPTSLGVAVDPLSDRVALRNRADGYRIESGLALAPLAVGAAADAAPDTAAATLSRSFDFPADAAPALLRRLHAQVADAASAPVLGRLAYRAAVAQTMLALGMGAEAEGVLELATADDPRGLTDRPTRLIGAAAALLAGRLDETAGLDPSNAADTDEGRLWRALRNAARLPDSAAPSAETTTAVAAGLPLLLRYPAPLAAALLPLAADALLRGGDTAAADRLLAARPRDRGLDLARAVAEQGHGRHEAALARYDQLTQGRDRSVRARAAFAALDLRVADHRLTPAAAADAGDRLIYAWRGDARERDARLRVAAWRGAAGQYRQQLEALREALEVFPDPADGVHAKLVEAFATLMNGHGGAEADALSPLDLVALVQENADLLPDGAAGEAMAEKLADRLAALDLPQRAEAVLERLVHDTTAPSARAALAARLAATELAEGAAQPALGVLTRSAAPDLSPDLTERRALLAARAQTALGDRAGALASLSPLADPPALLLRAAVQEDAHDWPAAAAALGAYADVVLPATGALDGPQSGIVLRLVSATAQAGDEAGLGRLRTRFGARLPTADDTTLLRVLTEQPVQGVADLPRLTRETEAAKQLPATLAAR